MTMEAKGKLESPESATTDAGERLRPAPNPLLFGEYLRLLFPEFSATEPPPWPPDVFALCLAPLWKSAAYGSVLNYWPPQQNSAVEWSEQVGDLGAKWRQMWPSDTAPDEVIEKWRAAFAEVDFPLWELAAHRTQCQLLLELSAISDEASAGLGIPEQEEDLTPEEEQFQAHGRELLFDQTPHGASLCEKLDRSRVRVLPKMHCPQSGLTIRSFSHHLAICFGDEIKPMWHQRKLDVESAFNLLVVPWPYLIVPKQFRPCEPLDREMRNLDPENFGFFTVDHANSTDEVAEKILRIVEAAETLIGDIHGVVLPELALSSSEHQKLLQQLERKGIFLVAGVGIPGDRDNHPANEVRVSFPSFETVTQQKHHRWKLEEHQISQYGLGSRLDPEMQWWEYISVVDRRLGFFSLLPWLVACILICEDLARPDPVGDLVRAVGPNLVIALLMDGPQLKERWSARYATTLADDPGSSVLSVTSLGMAKLSRPRGSTATGNPVVAIWKDAKGGGPVQIDLPAGYHGLVLSLSRFSAEEWSADGRSDGGVSGYPALTGVHPVKVEGLAV